MVLCPHCGGYVPDEEKICPACGNPVETEEPEEGVRTIRQGRRGRETMDAYRQSGEGTHRRVRSGASRAREIPEAPAQAGDLPLYGGEDGNSGTYERYIRQNEPAVDPETRRHQARRLKTHTVKQRMVNWTHVAIAGVLVVILLAVGVVLYLRNTVGGQRIMARLGFDADSQALWYVGEEKLDTGSVDEAITMFEKARALDGDENVNVEGLLLLGSAYEAIGDLDAASQLYTEMYTDIVPTRSEPYRNQVRILESQGRYPEAADLLELAYEKTGQSTFKETRTELIPTEPTVDLVAGVYYETKNITLSSPQGYDVYYTFDENAVLPQDGTLVTGPVFLDEGSYSLRAVAVNEDLVSDELTGTYRIIMPSPGKPQTSLAPGTYKQRQRIWLRLADDDKGDDSIIIYYTIDGSIPDSTSPVYTGESFYLPSGRVYLKAIAVNQYGKSSNMLEVMYKIEKKGYYPLTGYDCSEDSLSGLSLYNTDRTSFEKKYGSPIAQEPATFPGIDTVTKYTYSWGYAVFGTKKNAEVLLELYFTSGQFVGPRSTGIGMTETEIVSKFRDMGQVESPSGYRGLYYVDEANSGRIYVKEDGSKYIRYRDENADGHVWQLDYILNKSGVCEAIDWLYED